MCYESSRNASRRSQGTAARCRNPSASVLWTGNDCTSWPLFRTIGLARGFWFSLSSTVLEGRAPCSRVGAMLRCSRVVRTACSRVEHGSKCRARGSSTESARPARLARASQGAAGRLVHDFERGLRALAVFLDGHDGSGCSTLSVLDVLVLCSQQGRWETISRMRPQPRPSGPVALQTH